MKTYLSLQQFLFHLLCGAELLRETQRLPVIKDSMIPSDNLYSTHQDWLILNKHLHLKPE